MPTEEKIKQDPQKVLPKVSDSFTEKPHTFTVLVKPINKIHQFLIWLKIKPSKRTFKIKPQRVVNVYRIAGRAVRFSVDGLFESTDRIGSLMNVMSQYGDDIFYIVAAAIQNNHKEPSKQLIEMVKRDFEMEDILTVLTVAVGNYNIPAFYSSIALITGVDALSVKTVKASPMD